MPSRIYLVDDDPFVVNALKRELKKVGAELHGYSNPLQAVAAARAQPPDILIADLAMPEMTGLDLARELRTLNPRLRVVVVSTATNDELWSRAKASDLVDATLLKPWSSEDLLRKVLELLAS
jgi:CheY-like chemotaxis protein